MLLLEKEIATHSSILPWRIPGTGAPGGLRSIGSQRVRHDWRDLATAVAACSYCHFLNCLGSIDFVDLFSSVVFLDYRSPFNICCKAGLVVLNSLNFCLSEKLLISPSILNEILFRDSNLGCRFSPFSTLNISYHSFLAWRLSIERSAVKCIGFPLHVTCCFSLAAFSILS